MNVLSLFDGMSCGQIALRELGIKVDNYFASEIDRHAIAQTQLNFPNTIQLGSVTEVKAKDLPKIDLLIGGSPCQSFSIAGKKAGMSTTGKEEVTTLEQYLKLKSEGFQFEGQSYLFWEYMRILTELRESNPNILFLLENVKMKKKWEAVLSRAIGVRGAHINSALVSAQTRKRIYWTNIRLRQDTFFGIPISDIPQPENRGIFLKDILQENVAEKYFLSDQKTQELILRHEGKSEGRKIIQLSLCKESGGRQPYQQNRIYSTNGLAPALCASTGARTTQIISGTIRTHKADGGFRPIKSGKGACVPARARQDGSGQNACMIAAPNEPVRIRRLTPTECARLQTIPEWYKWECSEAQQYKMLGNGWTVKVIMHILQYLNPQQQ